jgi:hypothetical protein
VGRLFLPSTSTLPRVKNFRLILDAIQDEIECDQGNCWQKKQGTLGG